MERSAKYLAGCTLLLLVTTASANDIQDIVLGGSSIPIAASLTESDSQISLPGLSLLGTLPKFNDPDFSVIEANIFFTLRLEATSYLRNNGLLAIPGNPSAGPASIGGFLYLDTTQVNISIPPPAVVVGTPDPDLISGQCDGADLFFPDFGQCVTRFDQTDFGRFNYVMTELSPLIGAGTFSLTGLADLLFNFTNDPLIDGKVDYSLSFTDLRVAYKAVCEADINNFDACEPYRDAGGNNGVVPEPATLALLGLGLAGLGFSRRRKQ